MNAHGYEVFDDPYCYPGTFVLTNAALQAFELEMSALRAEQPLPTAQDSILIGEMSIRT